MAAQEGSAEDLLQCLPGDRVAVFYSDDSYWHERVLIWKVTDTSWHVLTPDFDLYEESFALTGDDGLCKLKLKGKHFQYFFRLRAPAYRFSSGFTEEETRSYIEKALDEMNMDVVPADGWRPKEVKVGQRLVAISVLLGRRFVPRRITRAAAERTGRGVIEYPDGLDPTASGFPPGLRPLEAAPPGHMWVWLPPLKVGGAEAPKEVVVVAGQGVQAGDSLGLIKTGDSWLPLTLLPVEQVAEGFRLVLRAAISSFLLASSFGDRSTRDEA